MNNESPQIKHLSPRTLEHNIQYNCYAPIIKCENITKEYNTFPKIELVNNNLEKNKLSKK
jgi:hypothetical protein